MKARLGSLDALRGIAAIIVVLVHLQWVCSGDIFALNRHAVTEISFGATGVILFFVISGFSLDLTMHNHEEADHPLLSYAASRFFRIAPLFYLLIPATLLRDHILGWRTAHDPLTLLMNFGFLFNLVPKMQEGIVWASWTIGIEVVFYAAFPLLYRLPLWVTGLATLIPYAVIAVVLRPMQFGGFWWLIFPGFLPLFVLGMWTHRQFVKLASRSHRWAPSLFVAAVFILLAFSAIPNASNNIFLRLPVAMAYAALLIGALLWDPPFLLNRLTTFYGALSYAIYLLHFPVLLALRPIYHRLFGHLSHTTAYLAAIPLTLAVLTPLAAAVYYGFEKPFVRLGRRLAYRGQDRRRQVAQAMPIPPR